MTRALVAALLALAGLAALAVGLRALRDWLEPWNRPGYGRML